MEYRTLGRSGCAVSSLCLGTMTFGSETDEQGAHEQLDRFVEAGGTLDAVSDPQAADYPYGEMGTAQRDRSLAAGR
jgi:predicted aldo/keto reductase-like oxidoreductase